MTAPEDLRSGSISPAARTTCTPSSSSANDIHGDDMQDALELAGSGADDMHAERAWRLGRALAVRASTALAAGRTDDAATALAERGDLLDQRLDDVRWALAESATEAA